MCSTIKVENIPSKAKVIIDLVDEIVRGNYLGEAKDRVSSLALELMDNSNYYLSEDFKLLMEDYFNSIEGIYTLEELKCGLFRFNITLPINFNEDDMYDTMNHRGFSIKCLDCGCTDVKLVEDYDEGCDSEYFLLGSYYQCNKCGQISDC